MTDTHSPLAVCALVPYPPNTTPSQRFRIEQWLPFLAAAGIRLDLVPFAVDARQMHLPNSPGAPVVLLVPERDASPVTRRLAEQAVGPVRIVTWT